MERETFQAIQRVLDADPELAKKVFAIENISDHTPQPEEETSTQKESK